MEFNFSNYLEVIEGITWNYFDNNYAGSYAAEVERRYDEYDVSNWDRDVADFIASLYEEDDE